MNNKIPKGLLREYPQLEEIHLALEEYKETGLQTIKCSKCNTIIEIKKDKEKGISETNCACGRCNTRFRWDPTKA